MAVKTFTKDEPCTKLDIWNCFVAVRGGFREVPVIEAWGIIGRNVPRVMERSGYLIHKSGGAGGEMRETYSLTEAGKQWLDKGFRNYLRNHPLHASRARVLPSEARAPAATRRIVRVRRMRGAV